MSGPITYTQCQLLRRGDFGIQVDVSWVPTSLAKKGKHLKVKDFVGNWVVGWVVAEVYQTWSAEMINAHAHDYKHQREVSDI